MPPASLRAAAPRRWALCWAPAALLLAAACSLDMSDLPENRFPVVGEIAMDPPPAALAPLDSFTLGVLATDPDDDLLRYTWGASGVGVAATVTLLALALGCCTMAEGPYWATAIDLGGDQAGAAGGSPGSPRPPMGASLCRNSTATFIGASASFRIG